MFKVHDSLLSALRTPNGKTIVRILIIVQLKITLNSTLKHVDFLLRVFNCKRSIGSWV